MGKRSADHIEISRKLGPKVEAFRRKRGLSATVIAEKCGVTTAAYRNMELGACSSYAMLHNALRHLGARIELGGKGVLRVTEAD